MGRINSRLMIGELITTQGARWDFGPVSSGVIMQSVALCPCGRQYRACLWYMTLYDGGT